MVHSIVIAALSYEMTTNYIERPGCTGRDQAVPGETRLYRERHKLYREILNCTRED